MNIIDSAKHTPNSDLLQGIPTRSALPECDGKQPPSAHPLPQFLKDLLSSPPSHGEGVHTWLFRVAQQLHAHRSECDIAALLAGALIDCGREVPTKEIVDAVKNSKATAWKLGGKGQASPHHPRWPKCDEEQRDAVLDEMEGFGLADLCECSPRLFGSEPITNELLAKLFPSDCLLCAGLTKSTAMTKPLREWLAQDMSLLQFVVPSPMKAITGKAQDGKVSFRCLDNTGDRRFLVIEFDDGTKDEQAAILAWLGQRVPLTLALSSGGKSLHGWFNVTGATEQQQEALFRLACELGADPMLWTRCQFVRMPDGTRQADSANGKLAARQTVCYFNPSSAVPHLPKNSFLGT